ncbi:MAG TPA: hypothetical protein VGC39_07580 [Candidatus Methylacidiphilales bacterium]
MTKDDSKKDGDVLPSDNRRGKYTSLLSGIECSRFQWLGEIVFGLLHTPDVQEQMCRQGKSEQIQADLKNELTRWKDAGYPDPKVWPLSSFLLSELGLEDNS